jgi:outer membrane protein TolC
MMGSHRAALAPILISHRKRIMAGSIKRAVLASSLGLLAGCTLYRPMPLPEADTRPDSVAKLTVDASQMPFGDLRAHPFDPTKPLDGDDLAMIAVVHNPQLRLARDDLAVAQAQSFAAGLLPDPQIALTRDHPIGSDTAGTTNAYSANISEDIIGLLQHASHKRSADDDLRRVNLECLWQEWQVVSQVKLNWLRLKREDAQMDLLESTRKLLAPRVAASRAALAAGNATHDDASSDEVALANVERQINELERNRLADRAALNDMLGLANGAQLTLAHAPTAAEPDAAHIRADLSPRIAKRPDMQALAAGYDSQEEAFRSAVLAQFPILNVGLTRARDTGGVSTLGFGLSLSLPIFNGGRGDIAVAKATRQRLYDEYQSRLGDARSEVETALANLTLLHEQLARSRAGLHDLEALARHADAAYARGNMLGADYVRLKSSLLDRQTEILNLQEAAAEQTLALETLLGPNLAQPASAGDKK